MFKFRKHPAFVGFAEFYVEILCIPLIDKSSLLQYNVTALTY